MAYVMAQVTQKSHNISNVHLIMGDNVEITQEHLRASSRADLLRLARFEGLDEIIVINESVDNILLAGLLYELVKMRHMLGIYKKIEKEKSQNITRGWHNEK